MLTNIRSLTTRTWIQCSSGILLNADPLLIGLNQEGTQDELAQRLSVELRQTKVEQARGEWLSELAGLGSRIYHLASRDGGETFTPIFEGSCTDWGLEPDGDVLSLAFHDPLFEFASHEDQVSYPEGISGKDVITDILEAYGFPLGNIEGPDIPMPRIVYDGAMGQFLMQVLQHGLYSGAKAYLPRWLPGSPTEPGKVVIASPGLNDPVYSFDRGNLLAAHERQSSESMVSAVWIVGNESAASDDARPPIEQRITVGGDDSRPKVGRRVLIKSADYDSPEAAKSAARTLLERGREPDRDRSATVIDVPGVVKGDVVRLRGGTFDGFYTILSVSHDEDARTMALQVGDRGSALYQAQKFPDPPAPPATPYGAGGTGADCVTRALLAYARTFLGTPYVYGGNGSAPGQGQDCSRFVQNVLAKFGIDIGRATTSQQPNSIPVPNGQQRAGDLVFYGTSGENAHVGIILEDGQHIIEETPPAVRDSGLWSDHGNFNGFFRVPGLAELNAANCQEEAASGGGTADGSGVTSRFGTPPAQLASLIAEFFPRSEWRNAADVAYLESGWDNSQWNQRAPDNSVGWYQINMNAHGGSYEFWANPRNNIAKAFALWNAAKRWGGTARWYNSALQLGIN